MAEQTYLYAHQMDEVDFKLYKDRLERAWRIVDEATDIKKPSKPGEEARYRLKVSEDKHLIAHVSRFVDRIGRPHFKLWTDHTDGTSNYTIINPLRLGEKDLKPGNPDSVLDHLELMTNEAEFAFSDFGRIGAKNAAKVEEMDKQAFEVINALIHAYLEFEHGKRFVLQIRALQPYAKACFHEVIDGRPHDFLTQATVDRLGWFLPWVSKVEYRRENGMSYYDVGPLDPHDVVITAEDMPTPAEIARILQPLTEVPSPHLLDASPPVRIYNW